MSVDDHQVAILMRCREGKEGALARTRFQVIGEVLTAKEEFCNYTETAELFIPTPMFPINTDLSVPFANITYSIVRHEEGVITSDYTTIELHHLLHFEPYMYLPTECLSHLYSVHPQPRTLMQQFIKLFAAAIVKLSANNFCDTFKYSVWCVQPGSRKHYSHPYQQTQRMFQAWQEQTDGTFQCLREHMDKYSVYSGRNILVSFKI